jgi:hypothetical protein
MEVVFRGLRSIVSQERLTDQSMSVCLEILATVGQEDHCLNPFLILSVI